MMMAFTLSPREMSQAPGCDQAFMETINKNMRVPERLSVHPGQQAWPGEGEEALRRTEGPRPVYTMQVPDRLTYTETPDMSPRPLFTSSKPAMCGPLVLEPCWEAPSGDFFFREALQSPIRRSYSDQSFGRMSPGTPTQLKQALALPRHPSTSPGFPLGQQTTDPQAQAQALPAMSFSPLSPQSMLQAAKQLGLQASQRLLQTVSQKYRTMENWSPEEEGGAAVEFIILRRQVMKISRRLAALERHNADRRNTEAVLFSLLLSACLLNVWLWVRR
ncbi:mitochondrial fission factor-like isoform X3 [Centropristis striata]|uniref:mitochondrial fission factor-like isoform X3 n=1 Tax=Centropristis striata TaxID=184440 RepID=UPI0027DF411C|nr:mitochondrial fission factor-like isoform X3 [Centropristis striata]